MSRKFNYKEGGGVFHVLSLLLAVTLLMFVPGCGMMADKIIMNSVVLEDCEDLTADRKSMDVGCGEDATFVITRKNGCIISGTDYEDYTLSEFGEKTKLTLHNINYPTVVKLQTVYERRTYHVNGGEGEDIFEPVLPNVNNTRTEAFIKDGYIQTGWNTNADGSGIHVGFGSRTECNQLYAEWEEETDSSDFLYEVVGDGIRITGYLGTEGICVLPDKIDGKNVRTIGSGAFHNQKFDKFICGDSIQTIESVAFVNTQIEELTLSDNLIQISDRSFSDCSIKTLRLNAKRKPVYAGSYFSTFPDKCERLFSLDGKKMVLFSGSSARYGYDSGKIEAAFPEYQVVNMGTYAYTNAKPQLDIICAAMSEGDMLIEAPEFDAAGQQFCESDELDRFFFSLVEEDYKLIEYLDLRKYTKVFDALGEYLYEHSKLEQKDYSYLPEQYDDDGNRIDYLTYNLYGDYILKRPNSEKDEMHRIIPADYTTETITKDRILSLNRVLDRFTEKGVTVLFSYAPRNRSSLTDKSTDHALNELERQIHDYLSIPIISELEDYFFSGIYFYEIDNHLSDEGVIIRTKQIIKDIKDWIEYNE